MLGGEFRKNGIRLIPTEEEEQAVVISWCALQEGKWPELALIYHVPNEGKRSKAAGAAEKRMGLRSGVADLCLPVPRGEYHGLYLEMKALDGRTTKNQRDFLAAVAKQGYFSCVCWGAAAAIQVLGCYLRGIRANPAEFEGVEFF
jgi:hypothetical protein